jgi:hypothetical protein
VTNLTVLGGAGAFFFGLATFVGAILTLRGNRKSKEALDAREAAELGIVLLRWVTKARRVAAANGWDQDPSWPELPVEATPEYLRGKAAAGDNEELSKFVEIVQKVTKGDPK